MVRKEKIMNNFNIQRARNTVKCADGFQMSVQASEHHYCSPKASGWNTQYTSVEIGFPTEKVEDLMRYIDEEESDPTNTVYTYVPAVIVCKIIANHGNMIEGEIPNMVIKPPANGDIDNTHNAEKFEKEE
jgi:uncharacterized membrane protein